MLIMDVLHVTAEISTLGESLFAPRTAERSLTSVLPEVVAKVAAFFEYAITVSDLAFEVHFISLGVFIPDHNCLVPMIWYPWKSF